MTYLAKLIHRALVKRPTFSESTTGERVPSLEPVDGMSSVECFFVPGENKSTTQLFGFDSKLDGVVYFRGGTDIRPNLRTVGGEQDQLTIADEHGAPLGVYVVTDTRNPMARDILLVAGVRRANR